MNDLLKALRDLQRHEHADFVWLTLHADGSGHVSVKTSDKEAEPLYWSMAHEALPAIRNYLNPPVTKTQAAEAFEQLRFYGTSPEVNDAWNTLKRFFNQD